MPLAQCHQPSYCIATPENKRELPGSGSFIGRRGLPISVTDVPRGTWWGDGRRKTTKPPRQSIAGARPPSLPQSSNMATHFGRRPPEGGVESGPRSEALTWRLLPCASVLPLPPARAFVVANCWLPHPARVPAEAGATNSRFVQNTRCCRCLSRHVLAGGFVSRAAAGAAVAGHAVRDRRCRTPWPFRGQRHAPCRRRRDQQQQRSRRRLVRAARGPSPHRVARKSTSRATRGSRGFAPAAAFAAGKASQLPGPTARPALPTRPDGAAQLPGQAQGMGARPLSPLAVSTTNQPREPKDALSFALTSCK